MRRTAAVLLALAFVAATPRGALATDTQPQSSLVRVRQVASRTIAGCTYGTAIQGGYSARPSSRYASVEARNAIITIETHVLCRGAPMQSATRQVYFDATEEAALISRIADIARVEHTNPRGRTCTFSPQIARQGDQLNVTDVQASCATPARGGGPRRGNGR